MIPIEEALNKAFVGQVGNLFNVLHAAISAAGDDEAEKAAAQERFKQGLAIAVDTLARAKEASGIS